MAASSGSFAPLRHRNFRWFWIASTVNLAGTTMAGVALAFAVLSISDSASALGIVLAAETRTMAMFLLFGGVIADRVPLTVVAPGRDGRAGRQPGGGGRPGDRRRGPRSGCWSCLAVVNGTASAITFPAIASIMPRLVPRELLQQANALQSFSRGALRVIGPTISALLVVGVGAGLGAWRSMRRPGSRRR